MKTLDQCQEIKNKFSLRVRDFCSRDEELYLVGHETKGRSELMADYESAFEKAVENDSQWCLSDICQDLESKGWVFFALPEDVYVSF